MAYKTALLVVALALALTSAQAWPHLWAMQYAPSCTAVPTKGLKCHKDPVADSETTITVTDASGKAVTKVCPGSTYDISVKFPENRLSYLTLNNGKVAAANVANKKCANTMSFSKKTGNSPATAVSVKGVAPPSGTWDVNVVSAKGGCEAFMISTASVPIGKC